MQGEGVILRGRRVSLPEGVRAASVWVEGGGIVRVSSYDDVSEEVEIVDAGDAVLMPGFIDAHVHVNDPGRDEWEGFETAARASIAGGVTTIVDMPLNSVPATTTVEALLMKQKAAKLGADVNVAFWGGVVPGNAQELRAMAQAGVRGFKCFLVPSGVPEFAEVEAADLLTAMPIIADLGLPLLVHAELPGPIVAALSQAGKCEDYAAYAATRPAQAEVEAVELMVRLCRETGARVHIVHVSAREVLPVLAEARAEGLPITAETCPHYLYFAAEDIGAGACEFKCAPPIRDRANRDALWGALKDGLLDMIASDHSPCPPEMKQSASGDFLEAWGGIASLQLGPAVAWTAGAAYGMTIEELGRWYSRVPAVLAGFGRKGAIVEGHDADLVLWRPDEEWVVEPARLHHRHKLTPYAGQRLRGVAEAVWVGGRRAAVRLSDSGAAP